MIDNALTDPLKTLPKSQLNAFKVIVKKIEWLLKDEIASALINVSPVTEATLDNVADHVKSSTAKNCQFHLISLRFVCGLEKSLQLFLAELSKARIGSYRLVSKGKYFYLAGDDSNAHDARGIRDNESGTVSDESMRHQNTDEETEDMYEKDGVDELSYNKSKPVDKYVLPEENDNIYKICQEILMNILDASLTSHEEEPSDENTRLRSGSLPLPGKENEAIVRRRFSDTGISYSKSDDLSLNLEDMTLDLQVFQTHDTPRKSGPDFWLFACVQGSEVTVYYHKM